MPVAASGIIVATICENVDENSMYDQSSRHISPLRSFKELVVTAF